MNARTSQIMDYIHRVMRSFRQSLSSRVDIMSELIFKLLDTYMNESLIYKSEGIVNSNGDARVRCVHEWGAQICRVGG